MEENSMSTKFTFMKEKDVAYLAFSSEERETTNEDGNTLPLHPSYVRVKNISYE